MHEASLELEDAPIFQGLSSEEMTCLREIAHPHSFKTGSHLLESGQEAPGFYVIRSGFAAAIVRDVAGREKEVATFGKGECVGEMALITGEPCSATVRATTNTEAWLIGPQEFAGLIGRYPGLLRNLGRILSQRLARTSRHLSATPYANTAVFIMDGPDDEAGALAVAIAASVSRQTGRRTLLIDARHNSQCPVSRIAPVKLLPSLSGLVEDKKPLKQHEAPEDRANGLWGARLVHLQDEDQPDLTEDQILTLLEWLKPVYEFVLLLVSPEMRDVSPLVMERASSTLALVMAGAAAGFPSWLDRYRRSPSARRKLEVAMFTGDSSGSHDLEAIEDEIGRPVTRLPVTRSMVQKMAREKAFLAEGLDYQPLRQSLGRVARQIGKIRVGLALGSGAAKGLAHIGVLRVLEENAVPIDYIAGCSIGAVVGAPYAAGMRLAEIERRFHGADRKITRWTLPYRSFWSDAGLKEVLREPGPSVRFRDVDIPFATVATDITTGREVVLRKGLVWKAVQASASIPGIFPAVSISGRYLVDGGLVNPVPSQTVRDMGANIVVAVDLMSPAGRVNEGSVSVGGSGRAPAARVPNLLEMLWRSTEIMQEELTARSAATADVTIEPKLGRVRWSDFSERGRDFIAAGEEATREKLPELRRLLPFAISGDRGGL